MRDINRNGGILVLLLVFSLVLVSSCAKQGFPPGGPVDQTPPVAEKFMPSPMSVNVPRSQPVVIEFSKPMNRQSVENSLFISPIPTIWPRIEWQGSRMIIHQRETLRENTTYLISVGSGARDLRGNYLEDSILLTFSTGQTIENGRITGRVIPFTKTERVSGVDIAGYRLSNNPSPDPRKDIPDYVTQTGADGSFELAGLSNGFYRIFAIADNDNNGFYTEREDLLGISPGDIEVTAEDSLFHSGNIPLAKREYPPVQIFSVVSANNQSVNLTFDRPMDKRLFSIEIDGLGVLGWILPQDAKNRFSVFTDIQENGKTYRISSLDAYDMDGNVFEFPSAGLQFTGRAAPDTASVRFVNPPSFTVPGNKPVMVEFDTVLDLPDSLAEIFGGDARNSFHAARSGQNALEIIPKEGWTQDTNYLIELDKENVAGISGRQLDSLSVSLEIRAVPSDTLGVIEGELIDLPGKTGTYNLTFRNTVDGREETILLQEPGAWTTGPILPGSYTGSAYRDDDGDGKWSKGSLSPYMASEQFIALEDTLIVAPRWKNENIIFNFTK